MQKRTKEYEQRVLEGDKILNEVLRNWERENELVGVRALGLISFFFALAAVLFDYFFNVK